VSRGLRHVLARTAQPRRGPPSSRARLHLSRTQQPIDQGNNSFLPVNFVILTSVDLQSLQQTLLVHMENTVRKLHLKTVDEEETVRNYRKFASPNVITPVPSSSSCVMALWPRTLLRPLCKKMSLTITWPPSVRAVVLGKSLDHIRSSDAQVRTCINPCR
jgi:hypothetical protein